MATRKKATPKVKAPVAPMTPAEMAAVLKAKFVQAVSEVANDAHAESVTEQIINDLNAQKRQVTLRLLGLDDRWGRWEVDHCNGRNSLITQYLADGAEKAIQQWVNDAVKEVLTTELKSKVMEDAKKAIHKEVQDMVRNGLTGYRLQEKAKPVIDAWLQQAANEVREELGISPKSVEEV